MDGLTICSGHVDGNLRLWDIQTGKLPSEFAAHSLAVTSLSLSRSENIILSSGRDNLHNLFDMRTLQICATLRGNGNEVASNWSTSCISPDDAYVAAGSADGSVHIWSVAKARIVRSLTSPVSCCCWIVSGALWLPRTRMAAFVCGLNRFLWSLAIRRAASYVG